MGHLYSGTPISCRLTRPFGLHVRRRSKSLWGHDVGPGWSPFLLLPLPQLFLCPPRIAGIQNRTGRPCRTELRRALLPPLPSPSATTEVSPFYSQCCLFGLVRRHPSSSQAPPARHHPATPPAVRPGSLRESVYRPFDRGHPGVFHGIVNTPRSSRFPPPDTWIALLHPPDLIVYRTGFPRLGRPNPYVRHFENDELYCFSIGTNNFPPCVPFGRTMARDMVCLGPRISYTSLPGTTVFQTLHDPSDHKSNIEHIPGSH